MFRLDSQAAQVAGKGKLVATLISHTPAHEFSATVAPFRAWRGLQMFIAGGPTRATIAGRIMVISLGECNRLKHISQNDGM